MIDDTYKVIYENLSAHDVALIDCMKDTATTLSEFMMKSGHSRETSLALTNLEQAMMWGIKAVCIRAGRNIDISEVPL